MDNTYILYIILIFILFYFSSKISYHLNLIDIPNKRKIHAIATAYTGGITLSFIMIFAIIIFDDFNKNLSSIISMGFLISLVGLIDDKYHLNTGGKLSLQIIPIFYLVVFENFSLINIGNYDYFKFELNSFAIPFTLCSVLFLINAFNYFDGIDGALGFTSITVLLILFFLTSAQVGHHLVFEQKIQYFLIVLIIPIIIFLIFNFSLFKLPKMILWDSGSLLLGFIISFLLIYYANAKLIHPILLAWSVVIFVYEFLSINLIRLQNKQGLFKPGFDHLHHVLLNKNKSILLTNFIICMLNIFLFLIGYLSYFYINALISLCLFIFLFIIFFVLRSRFIIKLL